MANEILKIEDAEQLEITDACVMKVTAATNGFKGGDSGHGSRTVVILEDEGSVDWGVIVDGVKHSAPRKITLSLGGDAELRSIIKALRFAANSLSKKAGFDEAKENAEMRTRWGCTGITKQQFFELGMNKFPIGQYLPREYTDNVFNYITGKYPVKPELYIKK